MMKMRLSILIPLLLVLSSMAGGLLMFWLALGDADHTIEEAGFNDINTEMTQLQNMLDSQLAADNLEDAKLTLSVSALHPGIKTLLLADEKDGVILASRYIWEGDRASRVSGYVAATAGQVRQTRAGFTSRNAVRALLSGYFPVTLKLAASGSGINRIGILYVEYDLAPQLAQARHNAVLRAASIVGLMIAVALVVAMLLHWLVSRRVARISAVSQRFAGGDHEARVNLRGNDELAVLGRAFDLMIGKIVENQRVLKNSEERFRKLIENSPISIAITDTHWNMEYFNRKFIETFGYTLEDCSRIDSWWKLAYPDPVYRDQVKAEWFSKVEEAVAQARDIAPQETVVTCKDGLTKNVEFRYMPIQDRGITLFHDITKRKKMEEALRQREAELNESQRLAHIGSWDWDAVNDTIWWSDEYYRIYGIDPRLPTPNYTEHLKVYTPESAARLDAAVKKTIQTGGPYELDLELIDPGSPARWVVARGEAKRDASARIIGLRGTAQNITERKRAEQALLESEGRYRVLFEGAPDAIILADPVTGIILDANSSACRLADRFRADIIGMHQAQLHPSPAPESTRETFDEDIRKAGILDEQGPVERRILRSDGTEVPVEALVQKVLINDRLMLLSVFRDITERKNREEQLAREAVINVRMAELSKNVLRAESSEEVAQLVFDEALRLAESKHGFVGYIDRDTGHLVCPTLTRDIWDQCNVAGKSVVFEKFSGLSGWVLTKKMPLLTNAPGADRRSTGVPPGHIPIRRFISVPALLGDMLVGQIALANADRDYTEQDLAVLERLASVYALGLRQRQTEEERLRLTEGLEQRVGERTADLKKSSLDLKSSQQALMNIVDDLNQKTEELEKANVLLKDLDRLKSLFIASMSHELRTPLNSVIGFSSILLNEWTGPVNAEQKENLAIILRAGKHLLTLINDVIDVSKIEAGKVESHAEEFELHELISEAVSMVEAEARDKGLVLALDIQSQTMYTDRRRLLQCVLNLLSNAVKFTEKGSVQVRARSVESPYQENFIEISVTDTGMGIQEEDKGKLFLPFVRLVPAIQASVTGTGLGLYLTNKLTTELLKGAILFMSVYGVGSTFTIRIPKRLA